MLPAVVILLLTAADSNRGNCYSSGEGTPPHRAAGHGSPGSGEQAVAWVRSDCHWMHWALGSFVAGWRLWVTSLAMQTSDSGQEELVGTPPVRGWKGDEVQH